jgi:hypothetical protein
MKRTGARIAGVLALGTLACGPTRTRSPRVPSIERNAVVRGSFTAVRGTFWVPPGCQAECYFDHDGWAATVTCSDLPIPISYRASLDRPPLSPDDRGVTGRVAADGTALIWGWTESVDAWFCAVATYRPRDSESRASHSWCALSPDGLVRARLLEMARSFKAAAADVPDSCGVSG